MSISAMTSVWKDAPVSGTELLLLLALADMSNDDFECWPSIKHLAQKVRVSDRQIKRLLDRLILNELIEKKVGSGKGKYKGWETNLYVITPDKWPVMIELMSSDAQDTGVTRVPTWEDARVPPSHDTRTPLNHQSEPSLEPSKAITPFIAMKNAIAQAFEWPSPSKDEWGIIQKCAKSLMAGGLIPDDVLPLYKHCASKFTYFSPAALPKNISSWKKDKTAAPINPAHVPIPPANIIDDLVDMPQEAKDALAKLKATMHQSTEAIYANRPVFKAG